MKNSFSSLFLAGGVFVLCLNFASARAEISANYSAGAVVIGPAADACAAGTAGSIRYNSATESLQFCNGSAWTGLSSGSAGDWTGLSDAGYAAGSTYRFKVGSGALAADTVTYNTAIGYYALDTVSTGYYNTALGWEAIGAGNPDRNLGIGYRAIYGGLWQDQIGIGSKTLYNCVYGGEIAIGAEAGYCTGESGTNNTMIGYRAHYSLANTSNSVAVGSMAGYSIATSDPIAALGYRALYSYNTGGVLNYDGNAAAGANALDSATTGHINAAIGYNALTGVTTGNSNTGVGVGAGESISTSSNNTAMGYGALDLTTTGAGNTAVGVDALNVNTTGSNNTAVGYGAGPTAGNTGLSNTTAIGYGAGVSASNSVRFGNSSITSIQGQVGWSNLSDMRLKHDIADSDLGLDFIMGLRPVSYHMINGDNGAENFGFIAQEVEKLLERRETNMLIIQNDKRGSYMLRYADFLAPIVKAIQEQQKKIDQRAALIDSQDKQIEELKAILAAQKK
jgi:hypothetical protein